MPEMHANRTAGSATATVTVPRSVTITPDSASASQVLFYIIGYRISSRIFCLISSRMFLTGMSANYNLPDFRYPAGHLV